jgi:gluconolactonase
MRIPNYPVVDPRRNCLYVSDSFGAGAEGPGVWRYDLETGQGRLWWSQPMSFANGMALSEDGQGLFVVETFARRVSRIAIGTDGQPTGIAPHVEDIPGLPDGIALDLAGRLYISCYEPSRILRAPAKGGRPEIFAEDVTSHLLCHPTNIAFSGSALYAANLGRWHITRIETDSAATSVVAEVERLAGMK